MKKNIFVILLIICIVIPVYSQEKKGTDKSSEKKVESEKKDVVKSEKTETDKKTSSIVYEEIIIEDFESTVYNDSNASFRKLEDQKGGASIRDSFPSPSKNSKKYLGIKIYGKNGDIISVTPAKRLLIDRYCKSISMWAYGKNFAGELSIILIDADKIAHRMVFGKLNFSGWKKLTVLIPEEIAQADKFLNQKREMEITKIIYNPGYMGRLPIWNYIYLDDISAAVRDKYSDKQSDEW